MTDELNSKNPFEGWTTLQAASRMINRGDTVLRYWAKKGYIRCYLVAPKVRLVYIAEVLSYASQHRPQPHKKS